MTKTTLLVLLGVGGVAAYVLWKKMGPASASTRGAARSPSLWNPTPTQVAAFYDYYKTPRENVAFPEGDYRRYQSPRNTPYEMVKFAQQRGIA